MTTRPHEYTPGVAPSEVELRLTGGRLTADVVRVGETVRRPSKSCSPFVARLLRHLEAVGFDGTPRYLGADDRGRDVFEYIAGTVHPKWQQWTDTQVAAAGRLLRAFHDATRGSALAEHQETVCHHDAGPNNFVFQNGLPVALIDFDFAEPGEALDDLAYMAWAWCISSKRGQPMEEQAAQVRLLADAYDLSADARAQLVVRIIDRLDRNIRWWSERLDDASVGREDRAHALTVIDWSKRERTFASAHSSIFTAALNRQ